jgi:hypothetical protein
MLENYGASIHSCGTTILLPYVEIYEMGQRLFVILGMAAGFNALQTFTIGP